MYHGWSLRSNGINKLAALPPWQIASTRRPFHPNGPWDLHLGPLQKRDFRLFRDFRCDWYQSWEKFQHVAISQKGWCAETIDLSSRSSMIPWNAEEGEIWLNSRRNSSLTSAYFENKNRERRTESVSESQNCTMGWTKLLVIAGDSSVNMIRIMARIPENAPGTK